MTKILRHLTLQTGQLRRSPRAEVSDEVLDSWHFLLTQALESGPAELPHTSARLFASSAHDLFTFEWRDGDHVLSSCAVSRTETPEVLTFLAGLRRDYQVPDPLAWPWLVVGLGGEIRLERAEWLGDSEKGLAWAWIEGTE